MTTSQTLLPLILSTITSTLTSLKSASAPSSSSEVPSTPSTQIRSDFITLLSLLSKQSTNYTLALKNPPEVKAAFQTLEKIRDGVEKLKFLEQLSREAGGQLGKRIRWALSESLESLSSFLSLSTSYLPPNPTSTTPKDRQLLLSSCKTFWKVVENIERDLPKSELEAVRKSWRDVTRLLRDCENELNQMMEGERERNQWDEEEEEEEEEEGEELSESQKQIISTCATLLRLYRTLVERIISLTDSTITTEASTANPSNLLAKFDSLPFLSNLTRLIQQLSEKADDLAGALEEVEDIEEEESIREAIKNVVNEIVETGESITGEIEEALEAGQEGSLEKEKREKMRDWFKLSRKLSTQTREKLEGFLSETPR
ncbi:uncharacterized protein JCM6883_006266 [Sporobolomyces salmoneus]|uniref:uncharacterized protein n=1 Tax=Sporobolomyces salmoneus TaxID=183962 RepID=UPI003179AF7F